ncbi:hypothetical protein KR100_05995 [Synechococcus sp. KORDI-100]|nr:hypothetical protein KR100_05995 [Synechococcus sp. KORDI-100]
MVNAQAQPAKTKPATNVELNTYLQISAVTFCVARTSGLDFRKSMQVALAGVGNVIFSKHGGVVAGNPKPLTEQQFASNTALNVVSGALRGCPKQVPAKQKEEFNKFLEEAKKSGG